MMQYLSPFLMSVHDGFNVINYITFRAIMSALTALAISLLIGPFMIRRLTQQKIGQTIRDDGPQTHLSKNGTPTMGGALILVSLATSTLLWGNLNTRQVWIALLVTLTFGAVGWVDDYRKVMQRNTAGLSAKSKLFWQTIIAVVAGSVIFYTAGTPFETTLIIPLWKAFAWEMGLLFIPFVFLVVVGSSNAVNLTDGLDGLAILPTVLIAGALGLIAYLTGHITFAGYLNIPYIPGVGELLVFCAALAGAGLGFLWFNTYPAQVFMGDVGALSLGAALGVVAVMVRQEFVLLIMGGVFVMETVSVILQVASFKLTGRRIFRMAPIHHHFELKGWPEPRVIVRFWIITVVLVLVGLATLKVR